MIANRRFSWHATLWQGGTHARVMQTERRRLPRYHGINKFLGVMGQTCPRHVAVEPNKIADMVEGGDAVFQGQICEPSGCVPDRMGHAVGNRAPSELLAHPRPVVIKLVHVILIELEFSARISIGENVSIFNYLCGERPGQATKAYEHAYVGNHAVILRAAN